MTKGKPLRTGSGKGVRANKGRGGCKTTQPEGKGRSWFGKLRPRRYSGNRRR